MSKSKHAQKQNVQGTTGNSKREGVTLTHPFNFNKFFISCAFLLQRADTLKKLIDIGRGMSSNHGYDSLNYLLME